MFVREHQDQFRNAQADVQTFYGAVTSAAGTTSEFSWNKPVGVSLVYILLVGRGGTGDGSTTGGGTGAVTVWFGNANLVPNILRVVLSNAGTNILYLHAGGSSTLLSATNGNSIIGAPASSTSSFPNSGFFQSTAGVNGQTSAPSASTTTFLQPGNAGGAGTASTANYGYYGSTNGGYLSLSPIIVSTSTSQSNIGGYGSGGGYLNTTRISPGFALIASW